MIFLTVGSVYPFDRLIRAVDELAGAGQIAHPMFAQIGDARYEPRHIAFERFLSKLEYDQRVSAASMLVGHAGVGTIQMALTQGKPLLVMPRLRRYGEHVDDHQVGTARKFEELGHVLAAYDTDQLPSKLALLSEFVPRRRHVNPERLARRIGEFLESVAHGCGR